MNTPFHTETLEYFKGKRVAVTGGSGFIGSRLVEFLVDMGAQVGEWTTYDAKGEVYKVTDMEA